MTVHLPDVIAAFNASQPWREHAACRGSGPDLFFDERRRDEARAVCKRCPVAAECREAAIVGGEADGIWGGTSQRQRQRERARRNVTVGGFLAECVRCGLPFPAARSRGIVPLYCEPCRPAVHAENVARSRRRQMEAAG